MKERSRDPRYSTYVNWDRLVFYFLMFLLMLILVSNIFSWVDSKINEDKYIYNKCADSCAKKHFMGIKVGNDMLSTSCVVQEFDRTECIMSCNSLVKK